MPSMITTARLQLVPMTLECATAGPEERPPVARATGARVPESWPVEHYDREVLDQMRGLLESDPDHEWVLRFLVAGDVVIGMFGAGAPDADGRVFIGYSVLPEFQRRGYASEALAAMVAWAYSQPGVKIVAGETYPHLIASIRTMERCGFVLVGPGSGEGIIRFERSWTPARSDS